MILCSLGKMDTEYCKTPESAEYTAVADCLQVYTAHFLFNVPYSYTLIILVFVSI